MKATNKRARVTLKTSPQPENRGRTDRSTHLRPNRRKRPHKPTLQHGGGARLKSKAGPRGQRGLKSKAAVRKKKKKKKKSQKLEMQRQEKTRHFSSSGHGHPPSRAWQTQQVLQNGLLNSRKLSQKWNDNKKPDDGQGKRGKKRTGCSSTWGNWWKSCSWLSGGDGNNNTYLSQTAGSECPHETDAPFRCWPPQNNAPALAVGTKLKRFRL